MLTITEKTEQNVKTFALEGRLDTQTAGSLEEKTALIPEGIDTVVLDFTKLEYISSAGLRVLLGLHKKMTGHGTLKIEKVAPEIMEIFQMTGFANILTIV